VTLCRLTLYTLKFNLCDSEHTCNILQYSGIYRNMVVGDVVYGYNVHMNSKLCVSEPIYIERFWILARDVCRAYAGGSAGVCTCGCHVSYTYSIQIANLFIREWTRIRLCECVLGMTRWYMNEYTHCHTNVCWEHDAFVRE